MRNRTTFQRRPSIDLGLAIMQLTIPPGTKLQQDQIAAFCGCTRQLITHLEKKALLKMRREAVKRGLELEVELMLA